MVLFFQALVLYIPPLEEMANVYKLLKLKKSDSLGFGFSILGGAGTDLPPIIYDIISDSPADNAPELITGDIIVEVNGEDIHSFTTKEVLNSLRKSPNEVTLKLKTDDNLQGKVKQLLQSADDTSLLKGAITQTDLRGIKQILAKKKLKVIRPTISNGEYVIKNNANTKAPLEDKSNRFARNASESSVMIDDDSYIRPSCGLPYSIQDCITNQHGASSMPSSPFGNDITNIHHFTLESPKSLKSAPCSTNNSINGPYLYPSQCGAVRISKSEDHLQDDNMDVNKIDLDDDLTASLNTLLDTTGDSTNCYNNACLSSGFCRTDNAKTVWSCSAPLSSPDSSLHSSHESDSPLLHSVSQISPQSATSSMQYSCSGVYDKIISHSSSNPSALSNTSSLTSPDTDIPDELDWDDTTPTYANPPINGFSEQSTSTNNLEHLKKVDENKIIIKVDGPKKPKSNQEVLISCEINPANYDLDRTFVHVSETVSPDTLDYQELCESEDETTLFSEKSDQAASHATGVKPSMMSPSISEDESDMDSLHSFHFSPKAVDLPSAIRLAKRLYALDGFKKSDVSRQLSRNNEFNKVVAEEYLIHYDFKNDTLDSALRKFLDRFCLTGETQERERVLVHFSKRYLDCNPGTFNSQDSVHTLTCAIMLLNSDLHASSIGRKMSANEFIDNLADLNDGENFPKDVLKCLYQSIRSEPLKWAIDDSQSDSLERKAKIVSVFDSSLNSNPFLSAPNGKGVLYKKGYVMRKCCFDANGKRTPFGKRSWKMYYCVIQDLVVYMHKDEQGARRDPNPQYGQNSIRLHHALAIRAHDYSKKEHVFRLLTADQAEYLLQTSDSKELQVWIDAINFVAASLSTPPMAGAVGSQKKFQRPLLPCSVTKLSMVDQLQDHKIRLENLEKDLDNHVCNQLEKNAKSSSISSYKEKEYFLNSEIKRYQTYNYILQSRLESSSESEKDVISANIEMTELPVFEAHKTDITNELDREIAPSIVPPPIPSRSRPSDSGTKEAKYGEGQVIKESKTTESISEASDAEVSKHLNARRRFSLRRMSLQDEFQREIQKMIKDKAKKDKKMHQKTMKAEKQLKNTIKILDPDKNLSTKEEPEDPRVGTFDRMSALFKFKKLNKLPESNGNEVSDEQPPPLHPKHSPPPLPPKPPRNSAIHLNVGTKIDI